MAARKDVAVAEKTPETEGNQLSLIPTELPSIRRGMCPTSLIDGARRKADDKFVRNVRQYGITTALLVKPVGDRYELIGGRRRLWAAEKLNMPTVPVSVMTGDYNASTVTLMDNALRSDNISTDVDEIERLITAGASYQQIGKATGLDIPTIKKRMRLVALIKPFRVMLGSDEIRPSLGEALAKLNTSMQERLHARVLRGEKLTSKMISLERQAEITDASSEANLEGFDEVETVRATDRDLIDACIEMLAASKAYLAVDGRVRDAHAALTMQVGRHTVISAPQADIDTETE